MNQAKLSLEELKTRISYNPDTGCTTWLMHPQSFRIGQPVGCIKYIGQTAYYYANINCVSYRVHRLVWFYHHGTWPIGMIDHIDGNGLNNKLSNLRDVDGKTNSRNRQEHRNGATPGILFHNLTGKWQATLHVSPQERYYLGVFDTEKEAIDVLWKSENLYNEQGISPKSVKQGYTRNTATGFFDIFFTVNGKSCYGAGQFITPEAALEWRTFILNKYGNITKDVLKLERAKIIKARKEKA